MPDPIVEVTIKPTPTTLRLRWGMTVQGGKWLWPHPGMEVRLYIMPFPDDVLVKPELFDSPMADRQKVYGQNFKVPFIPLEIERSVEQNRNAFRPGSMFRDADGACVPLHFDLNNGDIPAGAAICYPAVSWPVTESDWLATPRTFRVVFGYTQNKAFTVIHEYTDNHDPKPNEPEAAVPVASTVSQQTQTNPGAKAMSLNADVYQEIVDFIRPFVANTGSRSALINRTFFGESVVNSIETSGSAATFAPHLITTLNNYDGANAVVKLLETLRQDLGTNRQQEINALIAKLQD